MPIYEYRCGDCGYEFIELVGISKHEEMRPTCPKCKSANVEQVFSEVFVKTSRKS